jgi:hypothetical protein
MTDTNINCRHKQLIKKENEKIDFCKKCGCFLIIKYSKVKEVESFAILPKKMITSLDIPPTDTVKSIKRHLESSSLQNFKDIPVEYLSVRKSLIDMLKEYIVEYNFSTRSYFLGIYILDYIHLKYPYNDYISKMKLDLLVLGVFLVAVKFIDDDAYPPTLDSFPSKKSPSLYYSLNEVRKYEFMIACLMEFKLDHFTSYYLTETILSHGVVFTSELQAMNLKDSKSIKDKLKKLYRLALDINKMFVEDIHSLQFSALEIAATSVVMAKELLKFENIWNNELEWLYGVKLNDLTPCYNSILK